MHARRFTFTAKLAGAVLLVALADIVCIGGWLGPGAGVFALGWAAILLIVVAPIRRSRAALVALCAAILFGIVLIEDPSLLGWAMFWTSLSLAALLPRQGFDDALRWARRLFWNTICGPASPVIDLARVFSLRRSGERAGIKALAKVLALPLIGSAVFLALFAQANPVIGQVLAQLPMPWDVALIPHILLGIGVTITVWPSLRPRGGALRIGGDLLGTRPLIQDIPLGTLILSLVSFNAVFALQNGLDVVFLWSGAPLPGRVTLADYAHRGAYTLIATALLAGLFVLVALRPGSAGANSPLVRRLLVLWVAQNLLLVASSVLRLVDYIEVFSLTVLRISALAWMGLVAVGLVLICWRLLAGRSTAWLINANALAATLVLSVASVVDLGAVAADWNVRHARAEKDLDLCYLNDLGPSALLPLIALEKRVTGDKLRDRVAYVRSEAFRALLQAERTPSTSSLRGGRRLREALALLGPNPYRYRATEGLRECDGSIPLPQPQIDLPVMPAPVDAGQGNDNPPPAPLTRGTER